ERALGLGPAGRQRLDERAGGDLPGKAPAVLAPPALALLAAVADDRVPVAVRFLLVVRRDLEGERLALLERGAAVEADTRNSQDGELHREDVAGLAAREVAGRFADGGHFAVRKGGGVEACGGFGFLVVPEADRVLRVHGCTSSLTLPDDDATVLAHPAFCRSGRPRSGPFLPRAPRHIGGVAYIADRSGYAARARADCTACALN